jgi:glycolate oxidase iron-sulfur subunit
MQTKIAAKYQGTPEGEVAERVLRSCVHCGFCLATCPTYQVLGNELDSPRGRIYLMKEVFEGVAPSASTQLHLDRCLTCRNCETTCPSGVEYGKLLDVGRAVVEREVGRRPMDGLRRSLLRRGLSTHWLFEATLWLGRAVRGVLPARLKAKVLVAEPAGAWPALRHARRMLVLDGCAQPGLRPGINAAAARVLDRLGISLVTAPGAGCCGALAHHLNHHHDGLDAMRRNIDVWLPMLESGVEAIVMTASGCGVMVKDYGGQLRHDPAYAEKAARIAAATKDVSEVLLEEREALLRLAMHRSPPTRKVAWHSPCTLQHGQRQGGVVEEMLLACGFELTPVADPHLCCGSAGTYSLLQPQIADELKARKLANLHAGAPEVIATANIGCLAHLQSGTNVPVRHWIELVDAALPPASA